MYGRYVDGTDTMGLNPSSPYGITKLAAENLVKCYAEIADFEYIILRYFSVFGPGQRPDMAISQFLSRIKSNSEILVTGDGTQTRDLTYVTDVADATISALKIRPRIISMISRVARCFRLIRLSRHALKLPDLLLILVTLKGQLEIKREPLGIGLKQLKTWD